MNLINAGKSVSLWNKVFDVIATHESTGSTINFRDQSNDYLDNIVLKKVEVSVDTLTSTPPLQVHAVLP